MKTVELVLTPQEAFQEDLFTESLYRKLNLKPGGEVNVVPLKRSIDARSRQVVVRVQCELHPATSKPTLSYSLDALKDVSHAAQRVIVVTKKMRSAFDCDSRLKSVAHFVTNKMVTARPLFHHISEVP